MRLAMSIDGTASPPFMKTQPQALKSTPTQTPLTALAVVKLATNYAFQVGSDHTMIMLDAADNRFNGRSTPAFLSHLFLLISCFTFRRSRNDYIGLTNWLSAVVNHVNYDNAKTLSADLFRLLWYILSNISKLILLTAEPYKFQKLKIHFACK